MKPITVYTTDYCGYCRAAKALLQNQGLPFSEIDVSNDDVKRSWLVEVTGQRTVPQIFIGEESIGGYTELSKLIEAGELQNI